MTFWSEFLVSGQRECHGLTHAQKAEQRESQILVFECLVHSNACDSIFDRLQSLDWPSIRAFHQFPFFHHAAPALASCCLFQACACAMSLDIFAAPASSAGKT